MYSQPHTHTHTHTHSLTHSHTHTHARTHWVSHTHLFTHSLTHSHTPVTNRFGEEDLWVQGEPKERKKRGMYVHVCWEHSVMILIDISVSTIVTLLSMAAPAHYGEVQEAGTSSGRQHWQGEKDDYLSSGNSRTWYMWPAMRKGTTWDKISFSNNG